MLPTLFAFPYCFTDVGSSGKEPAVLDHPSPVFTDKIQSNCLFKRVHFSEANGVKKYSGHLGTVLYLLCLYHSVNSDVQNAYVDAFVYFTRAFFMASVLICLTCN